MTNKLTAKIINFLCFYSLFVWSFSSSTVFILISILFLGSSNVLDASPIPIASDLLLLMVTVDSLIELLKVSDFSGFLLAGYLSLIYFNSDFWFSVNATLKLSLPSSRLFFVMLALEVSLSCSFRDNSLQRELLSKILCFESSSFFFNTKRLQDVLYSLLLSSSVPSSNKLL